MHRQRPAAVNAGAPTDRPVRRSSRCRACTIRWAPLEILTAEQVERILQAAFRVLEEAGLEIRSAAAREMYRRAGALVEEATQMVRLGRDLVEAQLAQAPERFVLHARNPQRHLHVGGNVVNFGPVHRRPEHSRSRGRPPLRRHRGASATS